MPATLDKPAPATAAGPIAAATPTDSQSASSNSPDINLESDDAFDEFDSIMPMGKPKEAPKADKPEESEKPDQPAETTDQPVADDKPKKPETVKEQPPAKVEAASGPKQLRDQLAKVTKEADTFKSRIATLEATIKEHESKSGDITSLSETLAAKDKTIAEITAELRAAKQEASPEFKDKWEKPFNQAADYAKREIEELTITDAATDQSRPATWNDFIAVYNLPKGQGIQKAKELFGDAAGEVVQHVTELKRHKYQYDNALAAEKGEWQARAKAQEASQAQQQEAVKAMSAKAYQGLIEKHPDWFGEDPNDPDGNAILTKGRAIVAAQPKTVQESAIHRANVFHRAAAFSRERYRNDKLISEVTALKQQIEELKGSKPGATKRTGEAQAVESKGFFESMEDEISS